MRSERAFVLGQPRDGALAGRLAGLDARIVASVGKTTTMLVVSDDHPFGRFVHASAPYRKAEEVGSASGRIEIIHESALHDRLKYLSAMHAAG